MDAPEFSSNDAFKCRHSTSVIVFLIRKYISDISEFLSAQSAVEFLKTKLNTASTHFSSVGEGMDFYVMSFILKGWLDIPNNWACKQGYFGLQITSEKNLRLFAVSKRSSIHETRLYCFLCKRRGCTHTQEAMDIPIDRFNFTFDDDFEDNGGATPPEFNDLVSIKKYPCKCIQ